jgi:hypothetical protein
MTTKIVRYAILVAIAVALPATTAAFIKDAQECYLPLNDDNYWIYAQPNDLLETITIRVVGRVGEHRAYMVENWCFCLGGTRQGSSRIFKMVSSHTETCEINGDDMAVWYRWSDADGSRVTLPTWGSDCLHGCEGTMLTAGTVGVPAGVFEDTKTILYHAHRCLDQMPLREVFAPGIGLIMRIVWVDGLAQTWVLTEARVNGVLFATEGKVGPSTSPAPNPETTWGAVKSVFAE